MYISTQIDYIYTCQLTQRLHIIAAEWPEIGAVRRQLGLKDRGTQPLLTRLMGRRGTVVMMHGSTVDMARRQVSKPHQARRQVSKQRGII